MTIPTPDAYLIALADRVMARVQRRGYVLPRVLGGLLAVALVGAATELAVCIALGPFDGTVLAVIVLVLLASTYVPLCTIYRRDGAAWSPGLAKAYLTKAVNERVSPSAYKLRLRELVAGAGFFTGMFAFLDLRDWRTALLYLVPMVVTASCSCAQSYGACAMPVEPDTETRASRIAPVLAT